MGRPTRGWPSATRIVYPRSTVAGSTRSARNAAIAPRTAGGAARLPEHASGVEHDGDDPRRSRDATSGRRRARERRSPGARAARCRGPGTRRCASHGLPRGPPGAWLPAVLGWSRSRRPASSRARSTLSSREKSTVGAASTSWSRPSSRLMTFVTRATGIPRGNHRPLPLVTSRSPISDLVARVDHLDLAAVARRVARPADEPARARALVLDVDPEGGVDRELHVHRVARDVQDRADHAVGRDDRHVRPDVARALVEHDARDAEELGEVLADHLRAHRVARASSPSAEGGAAAGGSRPAPARASAPARAGARCRRRGARCPASRRPGTRSRPRRRRRRARASPRRPRSARRRAGCTGSSALWFSGDFMFALSTKNGNARRSDDDARRRGSRLSGGRHERALLRRRRRAPGPQAIVTSLRSSM